MSNLRQRNSVFNRALPVVMAGLSLVIGASVLNIEPFPLLRAQPLTSPPDHSPPSFEVASVKPSPPDSPHSSLHSSGGRINVTNMSVKPLIEYAFDAKSDAQVIGGPDWVKTKSYDISAKEDEAQTAEIQRLPPDQRQHQVKLMFQSLLIDRLKLKVRSEEKELPVYALVIAKKDAQLQSSATPAAAANGGQPNRLQKPSGISITNGKMIAGNVSMSALADVLSTQQGVGDRVVVDKTGLSGEYSFTLNWTPARFIETTPYADSGAPQGSADTNGTPLFTALKDQLGLKLEPQKGLVKIFVIEHIDLPSDN